jgi:hypothetical protein
MFANLLQPRIFSMLTKSLLRFITIFKSNNRSHTSLAGGNFTALDAELTP